MKHHRVTTVLDDKADDGRGQQLVTIEYDGDCVAICPEGYGEASAADGHGFPVLIERYNGELRLVVWADINKQDPTHIICLDGARETRREDESYVES